MNRPSDKSDASVPYQVCWRTWPWCGSRQRHSPTQVSRSATRIRKPPSRRKQEESKASVFSSRNADIIIGSLSVSCSSLVPCPSQSLSLYHSPWLYLSPILFLCLSQAFSVSLRVCLFLSSCSLHHATLGSSFPLFFLIPLPPTPVTPTKSHRAYPLAACCKS